MENERVDDSIPTPSDLLPKIPVLKLKHGDLFLYKVGEEVIAFRPLTLGEFVTYQQLISSDQNIAEDFILGRAVIYPDNAAALIDDAEIGEVDTLLQRIVQVSNMETFADLQQGMDMARQKACTAEATMKAWICAAFPGFKPDEIYNLSQTQIFDLVALAEVVLQRQIEFQDPEAEQKKKEKKMRGRGMMAPPIFQEGREPRRASEVAATPDSAPPAFMDFDEENRLMGMGGQI